MANIRIGGLQNANALYDGVGFGDALCALLPGRGAASAVATTRPPATLLGDLPPIGSGLMSVERPVACS